MTKLFDRMLESGQALLVDVLESAFDRAKQAKCESPIEEAMAAAFAALTATRYPEIGFYPKARLTLVEAGAIVASNAQVDRFPLWGCIFPQVLVDGYRVDFLALHNKGLHGAGGIVVECDGHDFHEKTKEQAARDKSRDRHLQDIGLRVFRFTGSEVWRDPFRCADEVLQTVHSASVDSENARALMRSGDVAGALDALRHIN